MSEREKRLKKSDAVSEAFKTERLKWIMGLSLTGPKVSKEKYEEVSDAVMKDEIERQMLLSEIRKRGPLTVSELTEATGIEQSRVLEHIIALRKAGNVSEAGEKEDEYLYKVI